MLRPIGLVFCSLVLLAGCGASTARPAVPGTEQLTVEKLLPLRDGEVYTYEQAQAGPLQHERFMIRVRRIGNDRAELLTGERLRQLELRPNEIKRVGGGVVLRAPFRVGATWEGDNGGTTRIDAVGLHVKVPAGSFEGCIRTIEESVTAASRSLITTEFCPDVGITSIEVRKFAGQQRASERAELVSFGPPMDLNKK